jgi:molybdopterin-containing oxidoreductase family membrane subunit
MAPVGTLLDDTMATDFAGSALSRFLGLTPVRTALLLCNFLVPQMMWSKRLRRNLLAVFVAAMFINVGMWLERFVIIVTSLHRDFIPSSWEMYSPTMWDFMTFFGTIGLFITLMFVFVRVLPLISIFEVRTLLPEAHPKDREGGSH